MISRKLRIAITLGEPAGVGPELIVRSLINTVDRWPDVLFTILGDAHLLSERSITVVSKNCWSYLLTSGQVSVKNRALTEPSFAGMLNKANGYYVITLINEAIDGALSGKFDAIVTAPVQKSIINDAGIQFTGHTEYIAERTHTRRVVMMLSGTGKLPLRIALATTHIPLKQVSESLTIDGLEETLVIIDRDLRRNFNLTAPRILVTGLNPHAGENGYLGREEIDVIVPALKRVKANNIDAVGPYPADTLFQRNYLVGTDCVLVMFHDQGLPVLKYSTLGKGINITLGLPIIRTSVDHGTALDLAGTGRADCSSMILAIDTAVTIARLQGH
ncbi:MAG: 4-hydroxythreonine-4-phosphate dehydrogenase PdxA [Burkholderia sp.]|nr:4-hydroxythreonine-4-phosphate dehydrogenase PdxA [Burkholderia sp.]